MRMETGDMSDNDTALSMADMLLESSILGADDKAGCGIHQSLGIKRKRPRG